MKPQVWPLKILIYFKDQM